MQFEYKDVIEKVRFLIKIPFTFIVVTVGFVLEFLIHAPFMVLCELDRRFRKMR
jgi:uncharacterized membrane protein